MSAAVAVRGLRVLRGGLPVLDGLTVDVASGRVTGLLGPSGSGKTTLLRAIVGVQIVAGGTVDVLGIPAGSPALRTRVAYRPQAPAVYMDLSVHENVTFFARVLGVGDDAVDEAIGAVDLAPFAGRVASRLSGGQLARVALATALLGRPDVLMLDEPTVGLDPVLRRDLWGLFHRLADGGAALLVSSHVMDEAERCDELLLMRDGALLATGTPQELHDRTGAREMDDVFLRLIDEATA